MVGIKGVENESRTPGEFELVDIGAIISVRLEVAKGSDKLAVM